MQERNTTLETTSHISRNSSENVRKMPDERIPGKLIGAIVAVGSLAFIGILTETVMTVLFPQLMREFNVDTATVQWITTIYLLVVACRCRRTLTVVSSTARCSLPRWRLPCSARSL